MPIGELIAETGIRILFEIILYGFLYWTGYILLSALTFGRLPLAPFSTIDDRNRKKERSGPSIGASGPIAHKRTTHRRQSLRLASTSSSGKAIGLTIFLTTPHR